ncbi:MAG: tyrosine-type recombinase/integrase, partial [Propionibacteriales bacterium]|nr:tyrosine-type recombinase/integrase [Propionibacteriales bacterium]
PRGKQLRHDVFMRLHWNPTVLKLGYRGLTPHALRHTFASEALSRGISLPAVANQLGHANPAVTARVYAHLLEDDLTVVGRAMDDAIFDAHSESRRNDGPDLQVV